jgi:cbb3-type cytochrome oxidase subunit 3
MLSSNRRRMAEATQLGTYAMILFTLVMIFYIWRLRNRNLARIQDEPNIAGQDQLAGGAINPSQFDEPDDDALDQMQDLLEQAAESQGLTYEE